LETLCGLFRNAKRENNKSDTCLGNLTWGLLPIGFQGVMKPIEKKKIKKSLTLAGFFCIL